MNDGNAMPTCPVEMAPGYLCDEEVLPAAPFPICMTHVAELYSFAHQAFTWQGRLMQDRDQVVPPLPSTDEPTVYYLATFGLVKIGWSATLRTRLRIYMPDNCLLATEPGSLTTERRRHVQFERFRVAARRGDDTYRGKRRRELFYPAPELIAHINDLRQAQGCAPVDLTLDRRVNPG